MSIVKLLLIMSALLSSFASYAEELDKPTAKVDFLTLLDQNHDSKVSQAEFFAALEKKFHSLDVDKSATVSVQELEIYGEKDEQAKQQTRLALKLDFPQQQTYSDEEFNRLVIEQAEQEFSRLDKNHDHQLSPEEKHKPQKLPKKVGKTPAVAEKNILKEDFIALAVESAEQRFFALDSNYDGVLSAEELGAPKPKPTLVPVLPGSATPTAQKNVDKHALAKQKLLKSFFAGIDANHDGVISEQEKTTAFQHLFERLDTNRDQFITPSEIVAGQHPTNTDNR